VRTGTIRSVAFLAILGALPACASNKPHTFGSYDALAPKVTPQAGERTPRHLTVELSKGANVAIFLVVPGRGSRLLFPADSMAPGFLAAGSHVVETTDLRGALSDTSALIRRPAQPGQGGQPQRAGRNSADINGGFGLTHGYLLLYASQDPLPYGILSTRVAGISIPIEDDDALNTVTKLIRSTTRTTGQWAAYATDFPP
jgi:hypothetical protein